VAGAFVQQASAPSQVRHLLDRAVRTAVGERRVTASILPNDLQEMPSKEPSRAHGTVHSGFGYLRSRVTPYEADFQRAAQVLSGGKRVAILVGAGALKGGALFKAVAEKFGARVAKARLGKAVLPDELPWVTGSIGPGDRAQLLADERMQHAADDRSGFPDSEFLPEEGHARVVQIDLSPDTLSLRYPMEVNLVGNAGETLQALLPLLEHKVERKWRGRIERWRADWDKKLEKTCVG